MQETYSHVEAPHADHVHVRFTGPFLGRQVTWDASIATLEHEYRARQFSRPPGDAVELRQFIEVGDEDNGMRTLRIGLNVAQIDEPVIRKTIIMVRQYRRLREGRHEYGEPWRPAQQP